MSQNENLNLKIISIKTWFEKKINQLEKNKLDAESFTKNHKEFLKSNKLVLKSQQRFRCEKHLFTEKVNKTALKANDDKRI